MDRYDVVVVGVGGMGSAALDVERRERRREAFTGGSQTAADVWWVFPTQHQNFHPW